MRVKDNGPVSPRLRRLGDKVSAQKMVKTMLDGAGLEFRALKYELAIINPRARENGEIRVEYETGHVTWRRVVRDHWGPLQGYQDDSKLPCVAAETILATLGAGTAKGQPSA